MPAGCTRQRKRRQDQRHTLQRRNANIPGAASIYDSPTTASIFEPSTPSSIFVDPSTTIENQPASMGDPLSSIIDNIEDEDPNDAGHKPRPHSSRTPGLRGSLSRLSTNCSQERDTFVDASFPQYPVPSAADGRNLSNGWYSNPAIIPRYLQKPYEEFRRCVLKRSRPRFGSASPHLARHLPEINEILVGESNRGNNCASAQRAAHVVLIGDCIIEGFRDAGRDTQTARIASSLNLGQSGDSVSNVLDRLYKDLMNLLPGLPAPGVLVWVVQVGTEDLRERMTSYEMKRLRDSYEIMLYTLLRISDYSRILVCGLFDRRDKLNHDVKNFNAELAGLVCKINSDAMALTRRVKYLPPPKAFDASKHTASDGFSLNPAAYQL